MIDETLERKDFDEPIMDMSIIWSKKGSCVNKELSTEFTTNENLPTTNLMKIKKRKAQYAWHRDVETMHEEETWKQKEQEMT